MKTALRGVPGISSFSSMALTVAAAALLLNASACSDTPVGNPCFIGNVDAPAGNSVVSSPVVDCESKICVRTPLDDDKTPPEGFQGVAPYCTAFCSSDDDCSEHSASTCLSGFSCQVATTTTRFCCQKLCVCNDYLELTSNPEVPEECDPENPVNQCVNLPGRE